MATNTVNEKYSMALFQCMCSYQRSGLHHGALNWTWKFLDRIFDAKAIAATYVLVKILNTFKTKLTALKSCKGVQYEYSTQISNTLACHELNVTYPQCGEALA